MSERYLLALDAGTGSGRCFLISIDGQRAWTSGHEWTYTPVPQESSMATIFNPDEFWEALARLVCETLAQAGVSGEQVVAISSASQREACVFLDADGRELYAGPNSDFRGFVEGQMLAGRYGDEIYRRSGHYPNGIFAPARLLWFKQHAPERYARFAHLLMMNDWILYRLCGEIACEPTNSSETCLYDLHTGEWMQDLLERLDLPASLFPRILPAGTVLGTLHARAAEQTGLRVGTPVVVGGADTQCGLIGSGALVPGDLAVVLGSTAPVQMVTEQPLIDSKQRLWTGAHAVPGLFVLESNVGGTGSIYRWFRDTFCIAMDAGDSAAIDASLYEMMNSEAALAPPGAAGVQSFLGVMVMNAKAMTLPSNALVLGMVPFMGAGRGSRALVIRALLESMACAISANTNQILEVADRRPDALAVCGGLARSPLFLEILANVLNLPVRVPRWREGTGVGTAICAGVGAGIYKDIAEGVSTLVQPECVVEPTPALSEQYKQVYASWIRTRETLNTIQPSPF